MNNENNLKNPPLVSIITPSFNSENFIEETILSVLNQSYKNIEYLIIDGGSKDKTIDIIKKYEDKLTYWISENDNGQSDAVNKGAKIAKGELITWIGADDILDVDCVKKIVDQFLQNPDSGLLYGIINIFNDLTGNLKEVVYPNISFKSLIEKSPIVVQPGSFYNAKYIENKFLDDKLHYCMDYELWLRIGQKAEIKFINSLVATFRIHNESKTFKSKTKFIKEQLKISAKYGRVFWSKLTMSLYKQLFKQLLKNKR